MKILVTGGLGFIGSAVIRRILAESDHDVVNVDAETYAATHGSVEAAEGDGRYRFEHCDINDRDALRAIFGKHRPQAVMHLAAESHVDRSIDGPGDFIQTNIVGTFNMLEASREVGVERFHHISTDEVYGSLGLEDPAFTETTPYDPRSPYSASKASSDHLVRAWGETFDLPIVITNCSNNYGEFQFPEKLIPLMVIRALGGEPLPVYGKGDNVRDWLHVDDHARALLLVLEQGRPGETYNVGGDAERTNLTIVEQVCDIVGGRTNRLNCRDLITHVDDRPGHDLRYSVDFSKLNHELGWTPSRSFEEGLVNTVDWYLQNEQWWRPLLGRGATARRGLESTPNT